MLHFHVEYIEDARVEIVVKEDGSVVARVDSAATFVDAARALAQAAEIVRAFEGQD
jgi:hypothetical protein